MNLGYTGKPYDAVTGLYNYGYRDYQPETARFTTVDPVRDGSNWFAYVNNDPVNYTDPFGLTASDKSRASLPATEDMVDIAATIAGTSFAKSASNELGKASMGVSIGAALVNSVSTTIQSESLAKGAYDLLSSGLSIAAGVVGGSVVTGGLTVLSGGTGAPIAAAAGWYVGYQFASKVSSFMDALGEKIFNEK